MADSKDTPLETALLTLLRPLVRLVLKRGMAVGRFSEVLKRAYVDVAQSDFVVPGRKLSASRVAVLTGLTRREATRLLRAELPEAESSLRRQVNRAARVVSAWVEDAAYHDATGSPTPLPFEAEQTPSFSTLVSTHGADVTPRAVLDELLRVGAVEQDEAGLIRLIGRAYIPRADETAKLAILGTDVADLVASIEHNLDPESELPFYQRKVAYDNLPTEYLPALRALLADRGQRLLEELNADMAAHDRDARSEQENETREDGERHRAMIGIYYFEEENDEEH